MFTRKGRWRVERRLAGVWNSYCPRVNLSADCMSRLFLIRRQFSGFRDVEAVRVNRPGGKIKVDGTIRGR